MSLLRPAWARTAGAGLALGRCGLGVLAIAAPSLPLRPWVGEPGDSARLLARALGGRDAALGLGALLAFRHEAPVRGWIEAGGLADAVDLTVTLASWSRLPRRGRWLVAGAAALGVVTARLVSPSVDEEP